MTALVVTALVLGSLLVLAAVAVPLLVAWPWAVGPDVAEGREYLRARAAAAAAAGLTVPAPRAPAAAETRPVSRQAG